MRTYSKTRTIKALVSLLIIIALIAESLLAPLGKLTRTKTSTQEFTSESGEFIKHIGDYYYHYITPQTACAQQDTHNRAAGFGTVGIVIVAIA